MTSTERWNPDATSHENRYGWCGACCVPDAGMLSYDVGAFIAEQLGRTKDQILRAIEWELLRVGARVIPLRLGARTASLPFGGNSPDGRHCKNVTISPSTITRPEPSTERATGWKKS